MTFADGRRGSLRQTDTEGMTLSRSMRQTGDALVADQAAEPESDANLPAMPSSRMRLVVGITIWFIWMVSLWALAGLSANPVTLNRRQIADAQWVIVGTVTDLSAGRVAVDETKRGVGSEPQITVEDLQSAPGVTEGASFVFPLIRRGDVWQVLSLPGDGTRRAVYPATPEVLSRLDAVVDEINQRIE